MFCLLLYSRHKQQRALEDKAERHGDVFIELNEIRNRTGRLSAVGGTGQFSVSVAVQQAMLGAFLNVTHDALAALPNLTDEMAAALRASMPEVEVTYTKVTSAKARIGGQDYREKPGTAMDCHRGQPVTVRRNKAGSPYFTLLDANRDLGDARGFTALKLEGLRSFGFADPKIQQAFEEKARESVQAG